MEEGEGKPVDLRRPVFGCTDVPAVIEVGGVFGTLVVAFEPPKLILGLWMFIPDPLSAFDTSGLEGRGMVDGDLRDDTPNEMLFLAGRMLVCEDDRLMEAVAVGDAIFANTSRILSTASIAPPDKTLARFDASALRAILGEAIFEIDSSLAAAVAAAVSRR